MLHWQQQTCVPVPASLLPVPWRVRCSHGGPGSVHARAGSDQSNWEFRSSSLGVASSASFGIFSPQGSVVIGETKILDASVAKLDAPGNRAFLFFPAYAHAVIQRREVCVPAAGDGMRRTGFYTEQKLPASAGARALLDLDVGIAVVLQFGDAHHAGGHHSDTFI